MKNGNALTRAVATFADSSEAARRERFQQLDRNYWERRELDAIDWRSLGLLANRPARVVDLGCGPASVLHDLWSQFGTRLELIGVDYAEDYLALAEELAQLKQVPIKLLKLSATELNEEALGGKVDLLYIAHAVLGFGDLTETLQRIKSCLATEGRLVIVETDLTSWSIAPSDSDWDSRREHMLNTVERTQGYRFDPKGIMPVLTKLGFEDAIFRSVSCGAALEENPRFFLSYEVFYPESEQEEAFEYISRVTGEAPALNRWGFKSYAVVTAKNGS